MHSPTELARMLKCVTAPYKSTVLTSNDGTANPGAVAMPDRRPLLMAGLGAATISCSAVFVALSGASPVSTAFYRTALALPVLVALAVIEQRRYGQRPLTERLRAALAGVFLAGDLILWAHAIADVGAGVATVLGNLQWLFVAGLAWLVWKGRLRRPRTASALARHRLACRAGPGQPDRRLAADHLVAATAARRGVVADATASAGRVTRARRGHTRPAADPAPDRGRRPHLRWRARSEC